MNTDSAARPVRLIIAGGRDFTDYQALKVAMRMFGDDHFVMFDQITVICGMARGADLLGLEWANEFGAGLVKMPAWWRGENGNGPYNRGAGHQRNERMAQTATHLLAFWNGVSTGTKNMINLGEKYKLNGKVIRYD